MGMPIFFLIWSLPSLITLVAKPFFSTYEIQSLQQPQVGLFHTVINGFSLTALDANGTSTNPIAIALLVKLMLMGAMAVPFLCW
jgi:hypothetical protein